MKYLKDHKHYKKNCICSPTYDLWAKKVDKKPFTYKQLLKAVKKAVTKGFAKSIILPIVFPNALGITMEEINRAKDKKTKKS